MTIYYCLPASTTRQDHVPATFKKKSCLVVDSCHLLTLRIYICGDFNMHFDAPVGDGYKYFTFFDTCDPKQLVN